MSDEESKKLSWEFCFGLYNAVRMNETHELRKQIYFCNLLSHKPTPVGLTPQTRRGLAVAFTYFNESAIKCENTLICRAIPCVAHIFETLFRDYKGFNNTFVLHLILHIHPIYRHQTSKAIDEVDITDILNRKPGRQWAIRGRGMEVSCWAINN
jgi:hypothetical protein